MRGAVIGSRAWTAGLLLLAGCNGEGSAPSGDESPAGLSCPATVAAVPAVAAGPPINASTPFAANCSGAQAGTLYVDAEVEPFAAINPNDPDHLVAVWQQDRWSNGGAQGLLAGVSTDGGLTWASSQAPFSVCSGGSGANGGNYLRATDPWVDFAPDGTLYWMSLSVTDATDTSAMLVSRSLDGGQTWADPITLVKDVDPDLFNDKNTLTADPTDANHAYAVWDRLDFANDRGPTLFSRTTDGGDTWEPARIIHNPPLGQTIGNVVAVHPDGALVNLFLEITYATDSARLRVIRSLDKGATWLPPVTIAELLSIGVFDPDTGATIRAGTIVPAIAVSAAGRIAVAWGDARFSAGARDGIALSWSDDGGASWSTPQAVNGEPCAQAFTPALRFMPDGTLGVGYYDLRDNTATAATLPVSYWFTYSTDLVNWTEQRVAGPVDMARAPNALGLFLGDYMAVTADATGFRPFFVLSTGATADRTNLHSARIEPGPAAPARAYRRQSLAAAAAVAAPLSPAARLRVRQAIQRALPHRRHDAAIALPENGDAHYFSR